MSTSAATASHGAQRARLAWTAEHVRREYALLRDEIARVVRRRARAIPDTAIDEGLAILRHLLDQGEEATLRGYWRARMAERDDTPLSSSARLPTAEDGDGVPSHG